MKYINFLIACICVIIAIYIPEREYSDALRGIFLLIAAVFLFSTLLEMRPEES
jgi:hypothetical protein